MGTPNVVVTKANGSSYQCPMCPEKTNAPYGRITQKIGNCSKPCSANWDALTFDEKQLRIDGINIKGMKPGAVAMQAA